MTEVIKYIPTRVKNASVGGHVAGTEDIIDNALGKEQSQVNQERINDIANIKGGSNKSIASLDIRLETVEQLAEISVGGGDAQIATGADFTNPDATKRAKVTTVGAIVDGLNDGVYDVSKRNPTAGPNSDGKFTLDYILSNADTLIPTGWRHGGMTISYVQTSDNKYVQYRLMTDEWSTIVSNWAYSVDVKHMSGNPEYMWVLTDKNNRVIVGINHDGDISFGYGCPKQIRDILNGSEGKALVSVDYIKDVVDNTKYISNPEWLYAIVDNNKRILAGIKKNGEFEFYITPTSYLGQELEKINSNFKKRLIDFPSDKSPYIYHYAANHFLKSGNQDVIPSESLADIEVASRLGFKYYIANVKETSDHNYVCIHGSGSGASTTFGPEVKSLVQGEVASELVIKETSLSYIQTNLRYDSDIPKYQTTLPTLEDVCQCCKEYGMTLFVNGGGKDAVLRAVSILGENNVGVVNATGDIREFFNGVIIQWFDTGTTKQTILDKVSHYGRPVVVGIMAALAEELGDELHATISELHKNGYLVNTAYATEEQTRELIRLGLDLCVADHEVNKFDHNYECFDIDGVGAELPTTTGSISNGVCLLQQGQTITCGSTDIISLGKEYLNIRFNGTLTIVFGSVGERTVSSDGTENIIISDYVLRGNTQLIVTASDTTQILSFVYKTSKC